MRDLVGEEGGSFEGSRPELGPAEDDVVSDRVGTRSEFFRRLQSVRELVNANC